MPALPVPESRGLQARRPLLPLLAIFSAVGTATTLSYFILAALISSVLPVSAAVASAGAYVISAVLSYYGHRNMSFASIGSHSVEVPRFVATTAVGLFLASLLPLAADQMRWPPAFVFAVVCLVIPLVNFFLLRGWVFRTGSRARATRYAATVRILWLPIGLALALACLAFIVQSTVWEINADTSWLITVIDRMHAGDRLYVDVIELNPLSSIWLYLLPVHLSYLTGIPAELMVNAYTLLLCAVGVGMTGWILRAGNLMPGPAIGLTMAVLFIVATVFVGNSFSERDHVGAVLLTPLIALVAWRETPGGVKPGVFYWVAAACAGGLIVVIRPYYALIIIVAAIYAVVVRRDIRLFFLPEFLFTAAMSMVYMAVFYFYYPIYFKELLPLLRETYMPFSWPLSSLALQTTPWLGIAVVYYLLAKRGSRRSFADLSLICAVAAWVPFFIQGKGWAYHTYPAVYLGSAAIIATACNFLFDRSRSVSTPNSTASVEIAAFTLIGVLLAHLRFFPSDAPSLNFAAALRTKISTPTVGLLGGDIAAGHPLSRMIGGRWAEPYCSDWIPTFALRMANEARDNNQVQLVAYYEQMAATYIAAKRQRLEKSPPTVLIVDDNDRLAEMMIAKYGFEQILANYSKVGSDGRVSVYRLASQPNDINGPES